MHKDKILYLIIHNVRSAYNVGSIFRSADGAGVKKIYLTGYTPAPFAEKAERYPTGAQKMLAKTALGSEKTVKYQSAEKIETEIRKLRNKKFQIISLENNTKNIDISRFKPIFPCALIVGNEVGGISGEILDKCDAVISIPMRGKKESLNVSVAAGIAMYNILK